MGKIDFNTTGNMITLSLSMDRLTDWEAANLFSALMARVISIDPSLEQLVFSDALTRRVNDTLYTGKPQPE
jgi:hypothetical protein